MLTCDFFSHKGTGKAKGKHSHRHPAEEARGRSGGKCCVGSPGRPMLCMGLRAPALCRAHTAPGRTCHSRPRPRSDVFPGGCTGHCGLSVATGMLRWDISPGSRDSANLTRHSKVVSKVVGPWPVRVSGLGIVLQTERWGFDSRSGHMPGLQVQSPFRAHTKGSRSMFLSHINVSLPSL